MRSRSKRKKKENRNIFPSSQTCVFSRRGKNSRSPSLFFSLSFSSMADESGGGVPPVPREAAAAEPPSSSTEPPPSSSSSSPSSPLLSLSVKNPARSCAPDFVLTARAEDSVAELKAKLSQTYEGKPPAERQTVRGGEEEEKTFFFF